MSAHVYRSGATRRRPRHFLRVLLLLSASGSLWGEELRGAVHDDAGVPLAGVAVLLPTTDLVCSTDDRGEFVFSEVEPGSYELLAVLQGYEEYRATVEVPPAEPLSIVLRRLVVDMGEITVEAGPDQSGSPPAEYTQERMRELPTGGDPAGVIGLTPGVLGASALSMGYGSYDTGSIPQAALAVRGTNPFGNTFFFDYIRAPTLLHRNGLPTPRSAIPSALTESVEVLRGGFGVEYGPGYGGIFIFHPGNEIPRSAAVTVRTSLLNLDTSAQIPIGSRAGLQISLRKSLYELTWQPLLDLIEGDDDIHTNIVPSREFSGEGDYLARLVLRPSARHLITVDCLGLTDYETTRPGYPIPEDEPADHWVITATDYYNYHTQGARWTALGGEQMSNTLYLYSSLLSRPTDNDKATVSGDVWSAHTVGDSVLRLAAGDSLVCDRGSNLRATLGLEGSWIRMHTASDYEHWESGSRTDEVHRSYSSDSIEASAHAGLRYIVPIAEVSLGVRGDYFGLFEQFVPSIRGDAALRPAEGLVFSLSGGTYSGAANYLEYLSATGSAASNEGYPVQDSVSSSLYGDVRAGYEPSSSLKLAAEGYVNWMRDLSGYDPQYSELWDPGGAWEEAEEGVAWGVELSASWAASTRLSVTGSYEYLWARYDISDEGWRTAGFAIPHTLRGTVSWHPTPSLLLAANLRLSSGYPFTPFVVTDYVDGEGFLLEYGEPNSARDWVPGFALDIRFAADLHLLGGDQVLFVDIANALAGPWRSTAEGDGRYWVGMDTRKASDRTYRFFSWEDTVVDFGIELRLAGRRDRT